MSEAASKTENRRSWLASYPPNVPAEMPQPGHATLAAMIEVSCRRFAARPAFTFMDRTLTYAELDTLSSAFAVWLQGLGLEKGDRVAVMMPNVPQYPVVVVGSLRAGMAVVNVNPLYTARELEHQLADCGARVLVVIENFAGIAEEAVRRTAVEHISVATIGDLLGFKGPLVNFAVRRVKKMVPEWSLEGQTPFRAAIRQGRNGSLKPVEIDGEDIAFLQYTGGTTGVAKGAMLTHANILANVAQISAWTTSAFLSRPEPERLTMLCALPLYHVFALTVNMFMGIVKGANNILIPNPRDIPSLVHEMARHEINVFPGLNTLFNALLATKTFSTLDFKPLMLTLAGGMAVQRGVARRWKAATGCSIAEGYGLSETSPVISANRFDGTDFTGTIGLPLPSTEIDIRDDDGRPLPVGEVGEICVRGPQVMKGYWNRPDETEKAMTADGFFRTGDMGVMDEHGYTKIVDRKKDMILVSGFNVYPNEIEEVVASHEGVLEAAAIGVPDQHSGEVVKLFVVRRDPGLTEADIRAFCRANLTNYKRPRVIEFRETLPKSAVGKILRRELRDGG
ncbi:MAG TPA: long-chain-fatty-acid--CoA ligase [Pararhizobium sp.]|nr:long-chain-fatty-acid--CoA ligase [Pararhizobium sp.]